MIIPHYYEDPHTLHVGTMPNMPAPTKPTARAAFGRCVQPDVECVGHQLQYALGREKAGDPNPVRRGLCGHSRRLLGKILHRQPAHALILILH